MKHNLSPGFTSGAVAILIAVVATLIYGALSPATVHAVPSPRPGPAVAPAVHGGAR